MTLSRREFFCSLNNGVFLIRFVAFVDVLSHINVKCDAASLVALMATKNV